VTDDDHGEEQNPLLVRPFLLRDADSSAAGAGDGLRDSAADEESTQTWPSATTREVRSQHAFEGADAATAILPLVTSPRAGRGPARHRGRRRLVVLAAVGAAVLLGATAAGFAALRTGGRPSVSAALPDAPIPALSGLVPPSPAGSPAVSASGPAAPTPSTRHQTTARRAASSAAATSAKSTATRPPATSAAAGKTTSPPAALAPQAPVARTGTIRGQNGLCLDLNGAVTVDFNHVQVFDCNNTGAQSWTLATDGTLRVLGKCALVVGDDTVHITTCDSRTTAQWRVSGQLLINAAGDKCLTDPSGGTNSGTAVTVTPCAGRAGQRWSLP